jgi:hypothetical protein
MLTKISLATGLIMAVVNLAVLFGWDITADQIAGINTVVVAAGALIHGFVNPNVPIGITNK